jgi:hypothetical protein
MAVSDFPSRLPPAGRCLRQHVLPDVLKLSASTYIITLFIDWVIHKFVKHLKNSQ